MYITTGGIADIKPPHHFRREPGLPFWTMAAHRKGSCVVTLEDGTVIKCGDRTFAMVAPNTPYENFSDKPLLGVAAIYFLPPKSMLPLLNWPEDAPGICFLHVPNPELWMRMYQMLLNVNSTVQDIHPHHEALAMNQLEHFLLLALPDSAYHRTYDPRILKVLQIIRKDPAKHWTVNELADVVNMSRPNFALRFTKKMGVSPMRYVEARRIEQAKSLLLHTSDAISQIADRLGYIDPYHFSNRFRDATGISPSAFRNNPAPNH